MAVDRAQLDAVLDSGMKTVSWVLTGTREARDPFVVQCHLFPGVSLGERLVIGVDDYVADQVRSSAGSQSVYTWLGEEFTLSPGPSRIVHSGGPADTETPEVRPFSMHGRRWIADVGLRDDRLQIVRIVPSGRRQPSRWIRISEVELSFVDVAEAVATEQIRAMLAGLMEEGRSYIEMWSAYNDIEREALVEEALRLKSARYERWELLPDGLWRFHLAGDERSAAFLRALKSYEGKLDLEAGSDLPPELTGDQKSRGGQTVSGTLAGVRPDIDAIDVTPLRDDLDADDPSTSGHLFRALTGDRIRLSRREQAKRRIWSGHAEMRGLAQLIEGIDVSAGTPRRIMGESEILSQAVRDVFGGGGPTDAQRAALKLALTTPDILLVQGPPGTGKTQFISALLHCLDQIDEKALALNRTLITSYQHDAVDNVVGKARRRGMPPTRVDSRPGRQAQSARSWREETLARLDEYLQEHRPDVRARQHLDDLRRIAAAYDAHPATARDLLDLLDKVRRSVGELLPPPLRGRLDQARAAVHGRINAQLHLAAPVRRTALAVIRSIRVSAESFADDGPERARTARALLDRYGLLNEGDHALLDQAADQLDRGDVQAVIDELRLLCVRLFDRISAERHLEGTTGRDPAILVLLQDIVDAVEERVAAKPDNVGEVLRAFRADLQDDLSLVEATLRRYNSVLATTVQQVDSSEMHRIVDAPLPVFDTVIVDEAARANPLDLMIPLACARKRIVLVGDHKQLPHALELKLERELRRTNRISTSSDLSRSLFERWFDMFDGIEPRLRTIRLDEQFRMHPRLGEFVSRVFYGGPRAVRPHPSTHALTHSLQPYHGKVAAWIDVPHETGGEERDGHSFVRECEAKRLVSELAALMAVDANRRLSFGVITFYKAQQLRLEDLLVDAGLGVKDDKDRFGPMPHMAWTDERRPRERLRVGTVDAFQGMEFDVVLLSVTRSSPWSDEPGSAVRRYGHLLRDSRMCVAMSRQRRLLIAVGDPAMADRDTAPHDQLLGRSLAEGLVAFRELCEGRHGVVRS
ncbi:DEAD/DEAH box helicase [Nonomuraea jabiensis]|uniref:AAA+ ATPase domain-containing protein n=1 Tax=Nonomuraea jabiensis TaxID=882448 RepID=A0A7W9FY46_9ACTN|nr:AAA domain-containing protein [Nonomuraea jabiensis]MBB5773678.1 hypothetical protein [Nonomuraea jabiensis]